MNEAEPGPLEMARDELAPGERLVWADRRQRRRRRSWPRIAFGLLFAGAALAWMLGAARADGLLALLGAPFLLVGIGVAAGWLPRGAPRDTVYAITDRRLLIIETGRMRRVRSLAPEDIETVERSERADGSGDLVFKDEMVLRDDLRLRRETPVQSFLRRRIGFFDIPDVRRVEAAVHALRHAKSHGERGPLDQRGG